MSCDVHSVAYSQVSCQFSNRTIKKHINQRNHIHSIQVRDAFLKILRPGLDCRQTFGESSFGVSTVSGEFRLNEMVLLIIFQLNSRRRKF